MRLRKRVASLVISFVLITTVSLVYAKKSTEIESIQDLQLYAQDTQKNIMLFDENNNISSEYHTDRNIVNYYYCDGKISKSEDILGYIDEYYHNSDGSTTVKTYKNEKLVSEHKQANPVKAKPTHADKEQSVSQKMNNITTYATTASTSYEDYYVNGVLMNDIAISGPNHSDDLFIEMNAMSQSEIQTFFANKNSILKNSIEIWRKNSNGTVYNTGITVTPSAVVYNAQQESWVNAKVILATLQKESSLIGAAPGTVAFSSRRFYFAMGMGATDSGDINSYTGFDYQVRNGAELLYQKWVGAPSMPAKITVNNGQTVTSNGITYKGYIWVKNWGTYSLYQYTPWTIDTSYLPTITGGNYLFQQVFKGYWGNNWS